MNRTPVPLIPGLPAPLQEYIRGAALFDSSCSENARVWFVDKGHGLYIKTAPRGTLNTEAEMTAYFHSRGFGAQVLAYEQTDADWLVTRAVPGEDCTHRQYLDDPKRLSEALGHLLRMLHETDPTGCPVTLPQHIPDLRDSQVLLHGDYCLPNILLDNWRFSGFIDVGGGGIGDRHIDLYWGCWSLLYNLKDARWCSRFLDAYGREDVDIEKLRIIAAFETF